MNTKQLFATFTHAINWNAFFYVSYKTLFTSFSFLLYKRLTTSDFATWANLNSTIFLLLLWIDCGFRKSIPRYCPEFAADKKAEKQFIAGLLIFQACLLLVTLPLFLYISGKITSTINPTTTIPIATMGSMLFISEGIIAIMRLIFHSYFWNKQFNLLTAVVMAVEMLINILLIYKLHTSQTLLSAVLITKIVTSALIVVASTIMLKKLYHTPRSFYHTLQKKDPDIKAIKRGFIKHSAIMWMNNNLKSLSERNFLIPFLTYSLGPAAANTFKVANDGALLFYRIVLKIIGTTDTSLFAHIEAIGGEKRLTSIAFTKLTLQIARLCLPLLGVVVLVFLFLVSNKLIIDSFVFHAFIIMAIGYLIETLFLPSERILEVKKKYKYLAFAYIPYVISLVFLFTGSIIPYIGLLKSIMVIHAVRLVSIILIFQIARVQCHIRFPFKLVGLLTIAYSVATVSLWCLFCNTQPFIKAAQYIVGSG